MRVFSFSVGSVLLSPNAASEELEMVLINREAVDILPSRLKSGCLWVRIKIPQWQGSSFTTGYLSF